MGLRLIKSENISTANLLLTMPRGKYRRLAFHVAGTNASGQTFAASDIDITFERGDNKITINMQDLQNVNNYDGGFPTNTSTAGSTLNLFACLDFFLPGDRNNILQCGTDDSRLTISWSNTSKVSTGTITVYAEEGQGTEQYYFKWKNFSFTLPASNSTVTQNISDKNVTRIYFRTASDLQKVSVTKDGYQIVNMTGGAGSALASYEGKAEAAVSFIVVDMTGSRQPADLVSSNMFFEVTQASGSSATSCQAYLQTIEINAAKLQESITSLNVNNQIAAQTYPPVRQAAALMNTQTVGGTE